MPRWTIGVEIELLAPPGRSRRDLAERVAALRDGRAERIFHPQAEPSLVPGVPVFETLTLGFAVADAAGAPVARFVDDLTLRNDLAAKAPPQPGWYRIAADDARFARLLARHCDPAAPLEAVLDGALPVFGGTVELKEGGIRRLSDPEGATIAIAAPLPGERERPCEIITLPIAADHARVLEALLAPARSLGFGLPDEGAVHLHFDGRALQDAAALQALLRILAEHGPELRRICRTNPRCRRLGPHGRELLEAAFADDFAALPWPEAAARLVEAGAMKYCDFNILNLLTGKPEKTTFEVRILPPTLDAAAIVTHAELFEGLIRRAVEQRPARA
ncbi:amidoligase family protein [Inquilinus limosus]|uniref:amidoligase family protein n=1 Tax=Inquilinus limosus TaxID=171674 RepID=UPI0009DEB501|nr:amidoligase family protein [Inquilinus limosus]